MGINEYIKIGNRIKKLRIEKGYSQKEMASICGISYSTYSNYENNNREPSMKQIEKIAHALNITTDELLCYNKNIDAFTIQTIDNYSFHIMRLLQEKDELSIEQQRLDFNNTNTSENKRIQYAIDSDMIQFQLNKIISDLQDFKNALIQTTNEEGLSLAYEILFKLIKLNPDGEKRILEEIETLSYNPKYQLPLKGTNFDPYADITNHQLLAAHVRTDIETTPEDIQHDLDIMDDDSWEE